jgi:hypothetical protein
MAPGPLKDETTLTVAMRWVGFVILVMAGLALIIVPVAGGTSTADAAVAGVGFGVYAAMGGLIIGRRRGHVTGWLLLLTGLAVVFVNGFATFPGVSPDLATWVESWGWTLVFAMYALLALTFPSGRLPDGGGVFSRMGRWAVWALLVFVLMSALTERLGGPEFASGASNPICGIGQRPCDGLLPTWLTWVAQFGTLLILLGAAISLVVRRRRAEPVERAQITWVVFALALLATTIVLTYLYVLASIALGAGDPGDDAWTVVFLVMILFPVAFAVAILRFRLYEIDRLISRTVAYALVAGALAGVFAVIAIGLPQLFGFSEQSPLLVAGATLAVAALFNPLRLRVQTWVDRRFNRARYDARQEVDRFAERLRGELTLADLRGEVIGVVNKTMQPVSASVWVRDSGSSPEE